MIDKEKILAKIEFLLNEANYEPFTDEVLGKIQSLKELKSYIDSLQEEPANEDLEEAAMQYAILKHKNATLQKIVSRDFKAGAKWQKAKDETCTNDLEEVATLYVADDALKPWRTMVKEAFKGGAKWQKEQMMANAIDMTVGYWMPNGLCLNVDETENPYNIDEGNKVKLIIIKDK